MELFFDSFWTFIADNNTETLLLLLGVIIVVGLVSYLFGVHAGRAKKKYKGSYYKTNKNKNNSNRQGQGQGQKQNKKVGGENGHENTLLRRDESGRTTEYFPYEKRYNLLSKREADFYYLLKSVCSQHRLLVFAKVRLADVAWISDDIKTTFGEDVFWHYFGPLAKKHIDFIVCDSNYHFICGIEVDDKSHNSEQAKINDEFKNTVFRTIGVPLFRFRKQFSATSIEEVVERAEKSSTQT